MRLRLAKRSGLKFKTRKEANVYSPSLGESAIKILYRLKRALKKPMTEILEEMIQSSLKAVNKEVICGVCVAEKNNECDECCLK